MFYLPSSGKPSGLGYCKGKDVLYNRAM